MLRLWRSWIAVMLAIVAAPAFGDGQQAHSLVGKWEGTLKREAPAMSREVRNRPVGTKTVLTIAAAPGGGYTVKQVAVDVDKEIALTDVVVQGDTIRWTAPVFAASYEGKLSADGAWIKGKWTQFGMASTVNFKRLDEKP